MGYPDDGDRRTVESAVTARRSVEGPNIYQQGRVTRDIYKLRGQAILVFAPACSSSKSEFRTTGPCMTGIHLQNNNGVNVNTSNGSVQDVSPGFDGRRLTPPRLLPNEESLTGFYRVDLVSKAGALSRCQELPPLNGSA